MPLWIIIFAALLSDISKSVFGAGFMRALTFVEAGSVLDLVIHRLEITPTYLPFSSTTARTGGSSFLKSSRHLDRGSFSLTLAKPLQ